MKTGTKSAAILTALLAGTVVVGALQQSQGQGQRRRQERQVPQQFQGRRQGCPLCGNPQFRPQAQGQQQFNGRQGPPQFQGHQRGRQGQQRFQGQQRSQQRGQQRGQQRPQQFQGQRQRLQQFQGGRQGQQQFLGQRGFNPQQQNKTNQKKAMLKKFDKDKDGQLSKEERQAVREAMEKRERGKPGSASKRPEPSNGEE